eukprot:SAG31_NODE_1393_length_8532_cov_4.123562_4_plen_27_part_01
MYDEQDSDQKVIDLNLARRRACARGRP